MFPLTLLYFQIEISNFLPEKILISKRIKDTWPQLHVKLTRQETETVARIVVAQGPQGSWSLIHPLEKNPERATSNIVWNNKIYVIGSVMVRFKASTNLYNIEPVIGNRMSGFDQSLLWTVLILCTTNALVGSEKDPILWILLKAEMYVEMVEGANFLKPDIHILSFQTTFLVAFYGFFRVGELTIKSPERRHSVLQFQSLSFLKSRSEVQAAKLVISDYRHNTTRPGVLFP